MSELAHLPRGLLSLEQWDALDLDRTRRWELGEGTLIMSGSRGTDHVMKLHEYAEAGIENYWMVDPDAPADDQFLAYRLDGGSYRRVAALDGDRVRVNEPMAMEFALDTLTRGASS